MKKVLEQVAEFMKLAAVTSPKTKGQDFMKYRVLAGDDLNALAYAMIRFGEEKGKKNFDRDAKGVQESGAVLLIGLPGCEPAGLNCGACRYKKCSDLPGIMEGPEFGGPHCAFRLIDLGIALGSAVRTAMDFCADNRIMYRLGAAARYGGFMDASIIIGIPLSGTHKNPFFDRPS
ncbi:MAG: DUF2148 domain-containing protein [Chloroflexi bacterium]|nr:DUF2148 domain-containing protein [Chloroflexota bacterium]